MLKMSVITSASWSAQVFNTRPGILSGGFVKKSITGIKCCQLAAWPRRKPLLLESVTCWTSCQISVVLLVFSSLGMSPVFLLDASFKSCSGSTVWFLVTWPEGYGTLTSQFNLALWWLIGFLQWRNVPTDNTCNTWYTGPDPRYF